MARKERALTVEIPRPTDEKPVWSRVGLIAAVGFIVGIVWPRIAGIDIGPDAPDDGKSSAEVVAAASASAAPSAAPTAAPAPAPPEEESVDKNAELVVVGPGTITRCWNEKGKKLDECGKLQFDPVAVPKIQELSKCPAALGLEGALSIGFEVDFKNKQVHVVKGKKTTLPQSTLAGVLKCAAREFSSIDLAEVPHEHRKYALFYTATFYPPGKHPAEDTEAAGDEGAGGGGAGTTTSESEAQGLATVSWDTALVRKQPKDGDIVARLVRGTRVKIVGKQNDWYRVDAGSKSGWVYRGAIGL